MISFVLTVLVALTAPDPAAKPPMVECEYTLSNVVPSLQDGEDEAAKTFATKYIPVKDEPFFEHVRGVLTPEETARMTEAFSKPLELRGVTLTGFEPTAVAQSGGSIWIGTAKGLFEAKDSKTAIRHEDYGVDGPLSTRITALAVDSHGTLWVGTPNGLSVRSADGKWSHIQGRQGLPIEDVTSIAVTKNDDLWIGTSVGAILHRPYASGRKWYYRAGLRYLPGNNVKAFAIAPDETAVYVNTDDGIGRIDFVQMTLSQRAELIEQRLNKFHRRLGLVAASTLDDAMNPTSSIIIDDDNDGLWTSYHVVAMSLAYAATGEEKYKQSAREGMHAMVMLQNASGTPGLVARSVLPLEEGKKKWEEMQSSRSEMKREQWRPTPDGKYYWKSDTSSDEIDGHYFAFYAYWEHIAKHDPAEDAMIRKQVKDVTDYIVDNGYYLIDWNGKATTWGKWAPEILNDDPRRYGENGLGALEMLSFLRTAYHITGDDKYRKSFDDLACNHGYLDNILLTKKYFPDENNHSDNQLACVAYYPFIQLEQDPGVREVLHKAVRRHYKIVAREKSTFFDYVFATIDPDFIDIAGSTQTLRDAPTDRRLWGMKNSHRADVLLDFRLNRHGEPILVHALPADERNFTKWNIDPFVPDGGGNFLQRVAGTPLSPLNVRADQAKGEGRVEDDGASWLLAYWMGRYHGFISE